MRSPPLTMILCRQTETILKNEKKEENRIIIGINNVDAGVRQRETIERLKAETATYNRISVLMGDFVFIYTVDPETCSYLEYSCASEYAELGIPTEGEDFFLDSIRESVDRVHEDDLEFFLKEFTRENVLDKTKSFGTRLVWF